MTAAESDTIRTGPPRSSARPLVVVTGAGRGIGRAIAVHMAKQGFDLEMSALDLTEARATHAALPPEAAATTVRVDFRRRAETDAWTTGLLERAPNIDSLIHNAGVGGPDPDDLEANMEHLDHVLSVNVEAVLRITRKLAGAMPRDGSGRIVIVASLLGRMGVARFSAYCTSKAAVIGLGRAMAKDLAPKRITVNMICPGWTDTAMAQQGFEAIAAATSTTPEEARLMVEKGLPLGRIVRPEEVAALAGFLASPAAGAMTGQTINMCAGDLQR